MNLLQAAAFFGGVAVLQSAHRHHALEQACQIVEDEAKNVIGTYDYGWPQLADATKEDRVKKGFSENEPGFRTGDMKDSIHHQVHGNSGYVGSDDEHLVYFEMGTKKQPPRSVLLQAALHKKREIGKVIAREILQPLIKVT